MLTSYTLARSKIANRTNRQGACMPSPGLDFLHQKGRVWIMGVLNATPDSFYSSSRVPGSEAAISTEQKMVEEGVELLDIGGESTRPGAAPVPVAVELNRVLPVLNALRQRWPEIPLSIDTQKAEVARQAMAQGARLVNDISALRHDPEMAEVVATHRCPVVLMHMQGTPQTMQRDPAYHDVIGELKSFFEERMATAIRQGIAEKNIILDPGIGFGKTLEHNLLILKHLSQLRTLGRPILVGLSRKSFIGQLLRAEAAEIPPPEERLEGTIAATLWAMEQGAQGLRVHDVGATRQAMTVWQSITS